MRPTYLDNERSDESFAWRTAAHGNSTSNYEGSWRGKMEFLRVFRRGARIRQFIFTLCSRKHRHANARLVKTCYDMNLSPFIRVAKTLLACGVASAMPILSFGQ